MIELVTGIPGSGKTLSTIVRWKEISERDNRPVYYYGIPEVTLPWLKLDDATKWMECEANAIVIIDEAQKHGFRPSPATQAPAPHIAAMETHRHGGIDLVLMTQQPMLVHKHCRELCGHHLHVVRLFGMQRSTVHEWDEARDNPRNSRKDSRKRTFVFPKWAYSLYKSAEVHTHKRAIPKRVWFMLASPLVAGAFIWAGWHYGIAKVAPGQQATARQLTATGASGTSGASPQGQQYKTPAQWMAEQTPRVPGLSHTAPSYDQVTQAVQAPYPAACVSSKSRGCVCYSQQGTLLNMPEDLCQGIVKRGFFVAWDMNKGREAQQQAQPLQHHEQPSTVRGDAVILTANNGKKT